MHMALGFACTVLLFFFVLFQALIHSDFQDWKWKVLVVAVVLAQIQRSVEFKSSVHKSACIRSGLISFGHIVDTLLGEMQLDIQFDIQFQFEMYSVTQTCMHFYSHKQ